MKTLIASILLLTMLTGCINAARPMQLPDGTTGYNITRCRSMAGCYNKAAEVCGGQYEVINSASQAFGSYTAVNGIGAGSAGTALEIAVKCKR